MIVLTSIEMSLLDVSIAANPYDGNAKSQREASFKINTGPVLSEIGDDETTLANVRDNSVIDFFIVLGLINSQRYVTGLSEGGFYSFHVKRSEARIERHSDKSLSRSYFILVQFGDAFPTFKRQSALASSGRSFQISKFPGLNSKKVEMVGRLGICHRIIGIANQRNPCLIRIHVSVDVQKDLVDSLKRSFWHYD